MLKSNINTVFLKMNFVVILGLVSLLFCFDFLDKNEMYHAIDFPKFNRFLKIAVIIYAIGFIIFHLSYVFERLKYLIYTVFLLSLIFASKYNYWDLYVQEFFRYGFILIVYPMLHFSFYHSKNKVFLQGFYLILKIFMIANIIAIFSGILFDIYVFQSYTDERFGHNGLILSQGLTPYVYMAATMIFWVKKDHLMLAVVVLASILSGIKGVYLGEFMLISLLLYFSQNISQAKKVLLGITCLVGFLIVTIAILMTPKFQGVIKEDGIVAAIFSFRIENLIEIMETSPKDSFSFIIGAIGLETVRVEMQLFDILLLFGLFGILIYTYFLVSFYKDILKSNTSKIFFITTLSLSLLSGNLLYIPLASLLFFITLFCLNEEPIG